MTPPPLHKISARRGNAPKLSLQRRVMLTAGLAVALVLLTDAGLRHAAMERGGRRGLVERAELLASIQGDALSVPLWNLDQDQVGAALDALAADPDFVSASVTKPDGSLLKQRLADRPAAPRKPPLPAVHVTHDIRYLSHGQARTLGTLHLSLSTNRLRAALDDELEARTVALLLLLGAVLLALYAALRQFTRPLDMMVTALTRLAAGDRETPIPASDQDNEVGEVARALQVFRDTAFRMMKAEGSYRAVFENAALGIYGADEKGKVHSVNAALLRIVGYASQAALVDELASPHPGVYAAPGRGRQLFQMVREREGFTAEISEIRRPDGTTAWISQTARTVRGDTGRLLGYAGTVEDVTDQRRRQGEERLRVRAAMESASDAILIVDETGAPLFTNRAFREAFGTGADGTTPTTFLPSLLADPVAAAALTHAFRDGLAWQGEADIPGAAGQTIPVLIRASAIREGQGASYGSVVICTNLSDRRRAEARIQHIAHHDWLTGLPNRTLFMARLNAAMQAAVAPNPAADHVGFAVLCVDLDRFKTINDTLGHAAGDSLLKLVAARLHKLVRNGDTVARIGGDDFTLIQLGISHADQAVSLAERLVADLSQPYDLAGREVQIGASVGIVLAPLHGSDPDRLLGFGDVALYDAKSQGRSQVSLFSPAMNDERRKRAELERDLRRAIAEGRLHLNFQPQFELTTGRLVGAEALLRWTDPTRGVVPPGDFIPVAEESGLIHDIGRFVLATACREAAAWPAHIRIAVNVSPAQIQAGDLIGTVRAVLAATGLAPNRLELEITEGVFMQDSDLTRSALIELKALGVRISLDDFGTGYSSLSYLRRMPLDKIKVDRSFVAALGHDPAAHALVRLIIGLAKVLGLETNAEGVETPAQAQMLRDEGCQEVQGYYFGRPMLIRDFGALDDMQVAYPNFARKA